MLISIVDDNGGNEFITLSKEQQSLLLEALECLGDGTDCPKKYMAIVELTNIFGPNGLTTLGLEPLLDSQ